MLKGSQSNENSDKIGVFEQKYDQTNQMLFVKNLVTLAKKSLKKNNLVNQTKKKSVEPNKSFKKNNQ